jgi:hypothetical protein
MPAPFVNATLALHQRTHHKVFVSFDGRGDATALRSMGCVFSSVLDGR